MKISNKQIIFFTLFVLIGFLTLEVKISHLAGSRATFTLFDSFAPITGAFLGSLPGMLTVFMMQGLSMLWHGSISTDISSVTRLVTPMIAVLYFSQKNKLSLLINVLAIIAFVIHPIGRTVWFFSLFWVIPILCYWFHDKSLLAKSFGATFAAHAIGGALWIWAFDLPREVWLGLIPVVIIERSLFGLGIAANYFIMRKAISVLSMIWSKIYEVHQS